MSGSDFTDDRGEDQEQPLRVSVWAETLEQFGRLIGNHAEANEWVRQVCEERWERHPEELDPGRRHIAAQRLALVNTELAEHPEDLAFTIGARTTIRAELARYLDVEVEGPAWRIDPTETERPTFDELRADADFSE